MSKLPLSERKIRTVEPAPIVVEEGKSKGRKLRIAAYCRVSTDSEEQETSFDSQVIYYTDLIAKTEDWVLAGIYADPAVSGTSRRHRQEFDRMLYDCLHGKIDIIITKSMSRFARNKVDALAVIRLLQGLHPPVKIIFEDDHISSDDFSAEIIATITAMLAEQESATKSSSVKWGFARRIEQGHYLTPTKFLLGYAKTEAIHKDDREMYIVEEEAKTVRVIYMMFLAGYRVSEIAYELTKAGVATGKGNTVWNGSSVLGILRNERYCGDVRTNKTYVENYRTHRTIKNRGERKYVYETEHHPAIVTHEEFEMAQKLIASHKYGYDPFVNGAYSLTLIQEGLLSGFIPINIHWAGSKLEEYVELSSKAEQTKDVLARVRKIGCFPGFQVVRRQDIGHGSKCSMTVTPSSMMLSASCLQQIDSDFVEILFNPVEKLIAIRPVDQYAPGAVRWKRTKGGKEMPVMISCSAFTTLVYELMSWPKLWNTNILAMVYQKKQDTVLFFDLTQTEISALPYIKPKPKKARAAKDVYYDIEAMIAQQIELLHNKQTGDVVVQEETEEPEDIPAPRRKKLHPRAWAYSFGQESSTVAINCRKYQFEVLKKWNVSARGLPVEGFNQTVEVSPEELKACLAALKPARKAMEEAKEEPLWAEKA